MAVVAEEYYGHDEAGIRTAALCTESAVDAGAVPNASRRIKLIRERKVNSSAWRNIRLAFLPEGYPNSVTPDYLPFQTWDTLQGLSTYIRSMLSTQALLTGIGVGQNTASVLGATFQWFLRDFTGMLGGILFTLFKGSNLDSNAKQWRLTADFMNDIGMVLDLLSPMFPSVFVFMLCMGSLSRSITGVASGATRAALTQHFALRQNAADVSAKEGSQETLATMVGMLVGMLVARITSGHVLAIWGCFLILTAFHMYANYRAVSCLCLTSLNRERVSILLKAFVSSDKVLTPRQVAQREQILPLPFISFWNKWSVKTGGRYDRLIKFGVRLSSVDFGPREVHAGSWKCVHLCRSPQARDIG
ncbi:hypothetical protein CBR_g29960 [Chara braunii]|uniref:Protein root UVB sensitive/RUS domain-containing protein n=1 Tax=Chara braunii TaxID=69332 RepID=A0A388LBM9_CHABU|nr:hypothetical protein CBR_g29960 [Chara braunii]|eukprot:GBG79696.1 hypothetical protein CBR_g29960 [Chara braunii]